MEFWLLKTDLVCLHGLYFHLPVEDNLYSNFVKEVNKHQILPPKHSRKLKGLKIDIYAEILSAIKQNQFPVSIFDLGSWVGEFGIRLACQSRDLKLESEVICVDPSKPGILVKKNAKINGVAKQVRLIRTAIGLNKGKETFVTINNHSDSAHLARDYEDKVNAKLKKVSVTTLDEILITAKIDAIKIIKLDLEGLDVDFLYSSKKFEDDIVIFEFAPHHSGWKNWIALEKFQEWNQTHSLFDIGYAPNPDRFVSVPNDFLVFSKNVEARRWGYTDLLAVPKSLVWLNEFRERQQVDSENFVYDLD